MDNSLKMYRDRLRIIIILYTFCERLDDSQAGLYGVFRSEIKIQALDFLLRYPDFLSMELMALLDEDQAVDPEEVRTIITQIYARREPVLRIEEMEKFFHGAYESIDDIIAFLVSVGFIKHESKRRSDGKNYDKNYYVTLECRERIERHLKQIEMAGWFFERCELLKKYFNRFSGTELKARQYRYSEYSGISYRSHIANINNKVKAAFNERFNQQLA